MTFTVASDKIVAKVLDGEAIIIDLDTGIYYSMDGVGAVLWQAASEGLSEAAILDQVASQYPSDPSAPADAKQTLDDLVDRQLLARGGEAPSGGSSLNGFEWPKTYAKPELAAYDDVADMVALDPPLPELQ